MNISIFFWGDSEKKTTMIQNSIRTPQKKVSFIKPSKKKKETTSGNKPEEERVAKNLNNLYFQKENDLNLFNPSNHHDFSTLNLFSKTLQNAKLTERDKNNSSNFFTNQIIPQNYCCLHQAGSINQNNSSNFFTNQISPQNYCYLNQSGSINQNNSSNFFTNQIIPQNYCCLNQSGSINQNKQINQQHHYCYNQIFQTDQHTKKNLETHSKGEGCFFTLEAQKEIKDSLTKQLNQPNQPNQPTQAFQQKKRFDNPLSITTCVSSNISSESRDANLFLSIKQTSSPSDESMITFFKKEKSLLKTLKEYARIDNSGILLKQLELNPSILFPIKDLVKADRPNILLEKKIDNTTILLIQNFGQKNINNKHLKKQLTDILFSKITCLETEEINVKFSKIPQSLIEVKINIEKNNPNTSAFNISPHYNNLSNKKEINESTIQKSNNNYYSEESKSFFNVIANININDTKSIKSNGIIGAAKENKNNNILRGDQNNITGTTKNITNITRLSTDVTINNKENSNQEQSKNSVKDTEKKTTWFIKENILFVLVILSFLKNLANNQHSTKNTNPLLNEDKLSQETKHQTTKEISTTNQWKYQLITCFFVCSGSLYISKSRLYKTPVNKPKQIIEKTLQHVKTFNSFYGQCLALFNLFKIFFIYFRFVFAI